MSETAIAGAVGLKLTLDTSSLNAEAKAAAERASNQFKAAFKSAGANAEKAFSNSFSGARASADKTSKHFKNVFQSSGDEIKSTFRDSFSGMESAGSSACESLLGMFSKVGAAIAAAFSVSKIIDFGKSAIEQAAAVTARESQMAQTFRDLEGAAKNAIGNVAKESGILDTRLQGVGTQIYAFAKTSGMDSVTALNMMKEALQTTADSAAYYDRSLEETAESLQSFLKGNYANDAALGVSATETTRNAAAMKLYGQSFQNLSEAQKQLTLLQMVRDANELSGAMGQAARESDGWENVLGNLKEAWNQLLAAVGKPILQGAVSVIKTLTGWISKLAEYAKAASAALGELFGWGGDETAAAAANTADTASAISESVNNENQLTQAVAKTNAEVKRGIAGFDKLNIISKSAAGNAEKSSNKIDNINTAGGNAAVPALDIDTDNAIDKIDDLKNHIISAFQNLAENSGFNNFVEELNKGAEKVDFGYIHDNIDAIGKDVNEIAKETAPGITEMSKSFGTLSGSVAGLATVIGGKAAEILSGGVRKWLDKDKKYIEDTTNEITGNMSSGFENLSPVFQNLRDRAALFFDNIKPITEGVIGDALSGVTHAIGEMGKSGSKAFETLTGSIKDLYFFMMDEFAPNALKTITDVINGIIDLWNQMSEALYGGIYNIGNGLGDLVKGLGSLLGQDWGWTMPEQAPQISHLATVNIPKTSTQASGGSNLGGGSHSFATGGIVKAPTLAVVGDNPGAGSGNPEVISPLNKLRDMIGSSDGQDVVILSKILDMLTRIYERFVSSGNQGGVYQFIAELEGYEIFREVIRQNELYKKSHGGKSAL